MTDNWEQPIKYEPNELWGDLNHLLQPVVGMLRLHIAGKTDREIPIEYFEERLVLALGLADLALSNGNSLKRIDPESLRAARAKTGTGQFESERHAHT